MNSLLQLFITSVRIVATFYIISQVVFGKTNCWFTQLLLTDIQMCGYLMKNLSNQMRYLNTARPQLSFFPALKPLTDVFLQLELVVSKRHKLKGYQHKIEPKQLKFQHYDLLRIRTIKYLDIAVLERICYSISSPLLHSLCYMNMIRFTWSFFR